MDMTICCFNCGKKIQDYPIFCSTCNEHYCSDHCHSEKHVIHYKDGSEYMRISLG